MTDSELLAKAKFLAHQLDKLRRIGSVEMDEYETQETTRLSVERLMQAIVDCSVDMNNEILFRERVPIPPDYHGSYIKLPEAGLVRPALAKRLASAAGLRSRIVHEYNELDNTIVHANIEHIQRDFAEYLSAVRRYLAGPP